MYLQEPPRGDGASSSVNFLHINIFVFILLKRFDRGQRSTTVQIPEAKNAPLGDPFARGKWYLEVDTLLPVEQVVEKPM